jgi:RNA methyltransferase, TrmH family
MRLTRGEARYLRLLQQKKHRDQQKKFLLEGWRALTEALASGGNIEYVVVVPGRSGPFEAVLRELEQHHVPLKETDDDTLSRIASTVQAQGVVALLTQRRTLLSDILSSDARLVVAVDALSDPGNLGTVLRTCDWFGVEGVLLGKGSVELYNEKVVRSSVGSLLHLSVTDEVDLVEALPLARRSGFTVVAASGDASVGYRNAMFGKRTLLVLGSEAHGLSAEVRATADLVVSIPRYGRVESLNVGVACGILLAHLRTQTRS